MARAVGSDTLRQSLCERADAPSGIMAVLFFCGAAMELLTQFIDIILHLDVHLAALTAQ
ncbi:MAG: hypothetical protein JNK97_09535, partial [Zoogloea sp.]|nr:hypothetical protein [Zoogloea sp.]